MTGHDPHPFPDMVLASASPRREALLRDLGWRFRVVPPAVDEGIVNGGDPGEQALRLAEAKADSVCASQRSSLVVAADTIVVLEAMILGKPENPGDAFRMLRLLSGKTHKVITGVAVRWGDRSASATEETLVTFRVLTDRQIRAYLSGNESGDKAGAYAIQGWGSLLVRSIKGCYFNVVGLPLFTLSRLLEGMGIPLEDQWGERV
ncbi:MAG: Maf family protein [Thermovirgaceae bacterium]|nr:Maf family protein [Synergistales bacterium]HRS48113.1 Maf family protein [Thermovirgaceae bacterium]HRU91223.1 Maf family protein [Thermovirgaceae bacterium]